MGARAYSRKQQAILRTVAFCLLAVPAACAVTTDRPMPAAPAAAEVQAVPQVTEPGSTGAVYRATGVAAWYGREMQGSKTASGEIFDMNGLTAAHRTLPLGTSIRVTNFENSKNIVVRVADRGPLITGRILDLSYGAAKELGFADLGVARVNIETLEPVPQGGSYTVQAALFVEEENAKLLKERLVTKFEQVSIIPLDTNLVRFFRVRVGSYASQQRAEAVAAKLALEGLEPVVLRKD